MSKGSSPRPFSISQNEFASNWDRIFKKTPPVEVIDSDKQESTTLDKLNELSDNTQNTDR
jgi:hypothetical protein